MMARWLRGAAALLAAASVAACGGGGDGGEGPPPVPDTVIPSGPVVSTATFQVAAALRQWLSTEGTYSGAGEIWTSACIVTPFDAAQVPTLPVSPVNRTGLHESRYIKGTGPAPDWIWRVVLYYTPSPLRFFGESEYEDSEVTVAQESTPMPEAATVGASGLLYKLPPVTSDGTTRQTIVQWSLEADTANTAWLCFNYACIRIDPAGAVLGFASSTP